MDYIISEQQLKLLVEENDTVEKISNAVLRYYDLIITSDYEKKIMDLYNIVVKIGFWPKKISSLTPKKHIYTSRWVYNCKNSTMFLLYMDHPLEDDIEILRLINGKEYLQKFYEKTAEEEATKVAKKINKLELSQK